MSNGFIQTEPCLSGCALLAPPTTTTIPPSTIHGPGTPSRSTSDVYVVFSSYQVASTSFANAACNTAHNVPVTLSTPFSVTNQLDNDTELYYHAQSSLGSFLGITECTTLDIVPTALVQVSNDTFANVTGYTTTVQQSSLPSTSSRSNTTFFPPTSQASRGLTLRQKNTIAVATSIPIIALSILGVLAWRRARKRRLAAAAITATDVDKQPAITEVTQPYLQQKAELEAAERRKHELEAHGIVYEMVGEDAIYEVATGDERRRVSTLQELRGTEHSKELEAPTSL